jgi:hypothetical protein
MALRLQLELTESQRSELEAQRDHARKPYQRERAAALLKIAAGASGWEVARSGLLKRRKAQTLYGWVQRYRESGWAGVQQVRAGRGRKAKFSPCGLRDRHHNGA